LKQELQQLEFMPAAGRIHSRVDCGIESTFELAAIADPHELDDLDVAIMHGEFAVAENAAVWVTDHGTRHRVVYFIAQQLVLVVDTRSIVHNMHQAYQRLKFDEPGMEYLFPVPPRLPTSSNRWSLAPRARDRCMSFSSVRRPPE
jgi:L-lactate dehydrogenase complex protein LldG